MKIHVTDKAIVNPSIPCDVDFFITLTFPMIITLTSVTFEMLIKKEVGHCPLIVRYRQTPMYTQTSDPPVW